MKQLTINIKDNKYQTFLEFIKTLDYVEVTEADQESVEQLGKSLEQVDLMKKGKMNKQSAEDFLNEL